jgi:hypothetical protein
MASSDGAEPEQGGTMNRAWRWIVVAGILTAATPAPSGAEPAPDEPEFFGPLRARDLSAFGYLRLDMRPSYAGTLAPGAWAVSSELGYQNTWALSPPVRKYLASRSPDSRRTLTGADVAAINALPGENYLIDLELAQLDVALHRQFAENWGGYLIVSAAMYGGGFFDGAIEQVHSAFGNDDHGRPALQRNQLNIVLDLKESQYSSLDAGTRSGLLDPTIGVRYSGFELPQPWKLVVEGAAKVPLAGRRPWLSTGRLDTGLQASLARQGEHHAVYVNASLVNYSGTSGEFPSEQRLLPTLVVALDSHLSRSTHSILQLYASPSAYDDRDTEREDLRKTKLQLSLGLRHRRWPHVFSFAVTENLANVSNTPDVGLQFGWDYRPAR